jgi:hypothetical protein
VGTMHGTGGALVWGLCMAQVRGALVWGPCMAQIQGCSSVGTMHGTDTGVL